MQYKNKEKDIQYFLVGAGLAIVVFFGTRVGAQAVGPVENGSATTVPTSSVTETSTTMPATTPTAPAAPYAPASIPTSSVESFTKLPEPTPSLPAPPPSFGGFQSQRPAHNTDGFSGFGMPGGGMSGGMGGGGGMFMPQRMSGMQRPAPAFEGRGGGRPPGEGGLRRAPGPQNDSRMLEKALDKLEEINISGCSSKTAKDAKKCFSKLLSKTQKICRSARLDCGDLSALKLDIRELGRRDSDVTVAEVAEDFQEGLDDLVEEIEDRLDLSDEEDFEEDFEFEDHGGPQGGGPFGGPGPMDPFGGMGMNGGMGSRSPFGY